jgi:hypothetical protein
MKSSRGKQQFLEVNYQYDQEVDLMNRELKYQRRSKIKDYSPSVMRFRKMERPLKSFLQFC